MSNLKLQTVEVLLYGENRNLASLQKAALEAFNFKKTLWVQSQKALKESVTLTARDIIILNDSPEVNLEETVRMLRTDPVNANPFAIILVMTPSPSRAYLLHILRIGVDGVIGLPFSATDLWKQLAFFVNNRRTFLKTHSYFGPDRRRLKGIKYAGDERRAGDEFDEDYKVKNVANY